MENLLLNKSAAKKNNTQNKKCKKCNKKVKYVKQTPKNSKIYDNKHYLLVYLKTLLGVYKNLPNIISILDKIIERRATSLTSTSSIYSSTYIETYNQVNKVINLSDRKSKLLNLYVIIEKVLDSLKVDDRKIIIYKFVQKSKVSDIAKEVGCCDRSVFRRIDSIMNKMVDFMLDKNWTLEFLKNQIGNESWIEDAFKQNLKQEEL